MYTPSKSFPDFRKYICYKENIAMWNTVMWHIVITRGFLLLLSVPLNGRVRKSVLYTLGRN